MATRDINDYPTVSKINNTDKVVASVGGTLKLVKVETLNAPQDTRLNALDSQMEMVTRALENAIYLFQNTVYTDDYRDTTKGQAFIEAVNQLKASVGGGE
jgi:hypothetical protein